MSCFKALPPVDDNVNGYTSNICGCTEELCGVPPDGWLWGGIRVTNLCYATIDDFVLDYKKYQYRALHLHQAAVTHVNDTFRGGSVSKAGTYYSLPYDGQRILKWEDDVQSSTALTTLIDCDAACFWGGVSEGNKRYIYGIPHSSTAMLKIDTYTDVVSTFGGVQAGAEKWAEGTLHVQKTLNQHSTSEV